MYNSHSRSRSALSLLPLAAVAVTASAQSEALHTAADAHPAQHAENWTFHHEHVLGTSLEIRVRAANLQQARAAEAAILATFDHDDAILSTWRQDSEISRWAATRFQPLEVSPELFDVLAAFDY